MPANTAIDLLALRGCQIDDLDSAALLQQTEKEGLASIASS
jgi:hypothetical protein